MKRGKLPYREGTWFAVPLRSTGFATGAVTRTSKTGRVIVGYFFGPRRASVAALHEVDGLLPTASALVVRFGDLGLIDGTWPIIGHSETWRRSEWPMPEFISTDPLTGRSFRVRYDDDDPNKLGIREPLVAPDASLSPDGLWGAGAVEVRLERLL